MTITITPQHEGFLHTSNVFLPVKSIYVHSKLMIIDDELLVGGSTNMDNFSFYYSSELSVSILNPTVAVETKVRLIKEHLGAYYAPTMASNFDHVFHAFRLVSVV